MASTSTSFHDADGTTTSVDEPMLPVDNGDDTTRCEDESMMQVDNEDVEEDVPPPSATRFKVVVSKSRHSTITEDSYARNHGAAPVLRILHCDGDAPCPVTVVDEAGAARLALHPLGGTPRRGFTVQNCCGALACLRSGQRDAELLNPATGESLGLGHFFRHGPSSTWTHAEHLPWYCLGRCAAGTGEYKVVRLDVRLPSSSPPRVTCEVLALGPESWDSSGRFAPEWKKVGLWHVSYCPADRGVHVDGVVYYLAWCVAGAVMIVSFDLSKHKVSEIDLPAAATEARGGAVVASLSELDGRLCLSLVPGGEETRTRRGTTGAAMSIYVRGDDPQRTDDDGKAWFQVCRIELDVAARCVPRPVLRRGGRMLMKRADGSLCYYDMDGASGGKGAAAGEEVVYEPKGGCRRRKQQRSGMTADVFEESPLPLQAILRGTETREEKESFLQLMADLSTLAL